MVEAEWRSGAAKSYCLLCISAPEKPDSQPCNSLSAVIKILMMIIIIPLKPPTFLPFMPLPVCQCKLQCHSKNLTLARRVLKKSFQIPLTGVTAILWVESKAWPPSRSLCVKAFHLHSKCSQLSLRAQNAKKICQKGGTTIFHIIQPICQNNENFVCWFWIRFNWNKNTKWNEQLGWCLFIGSQVITSKPYLYYTIV